MAEAAAETQDKVKVYFDGLCHLCSREIDHYRGMRGAEKIRFIDITGADFNAEMEGLDPVAIHKHIHARDKNGQVQLGVDAFICIWSELEAMKFLVPIVQSRPVHFTLSVLYAGFAKVRPLLPRKSCEASPYCEVRKP